MIRVAPRSRLIPIAETGETFVDFRPYVASINNSGTVAFQATLENGASGIFSGNGGAVHAAIVSDGDRVCRIDSHPDIDDSHNICFYGAYGAGVQAVYLLSGESLSIVADTRPMTAMANGADFSRIGPLGPTMADDAIAFRAHTVDGRHVVATSRAGGTSINATTACRFTDFEGLPIASAMEQTVFRATERGGVQGIYASNLEKTSTVVDTSREFSQLCRFPSTDEHGSVIFTALCNGAAGVYRSFDGVLETLCDATGAFESFRGAVSGSHGAAFWLANPRNGALGLYAGPDPSTDRIIAVGDCLMGSTVAEFALNPVSVNACNQLAVRLLLEDHRQIIARLDMEYD